MGSDEKYMHFTPSTIWRRLLQEESGQDLIEYAILTAIVTLGSLAIFSLISTKMETAYKNWSAEIQDGRFHPSDPIPPTP